MIAEFENFTALKGALDSHESELEGIALDHYQYFHYKTIFSDDIYKSKLHASNQITVGILLAGGGPGEVEDH